jgi:hypothetical protein
MGASPNIEDLAKQNVAFQKYIDERNAELDKASQDAKVRMDAQIAAFYKEGNWSDAKPLVSGQYQHLATASTWSLDHVIGMIDAVRGAVFGEAPAAKAAAKDPASKVPNIGTDPEIKPVDTATKTLMAAMGGTEMIIANAAFQAISGVLAAFKSTTETDLVKNVIQKEVVPGLSLFVTVMENKFHRSDFFTDEIIVQNFYIFETRMSLQRAADIAKFDRMKGLQQQQIDLETQASDFSNQIGTLHFADYKTKYGADAVKKYKSDFDDLHTMVEMFNAQIDEIGKKIDALRTARRAAAQAMYTSKRKVLLAA